MHVTLAQVTFVTSTGSPCGKKKARHPKKVREVVCMKFWGAQWLVRATRRKGRVLTRGAGGCWPWL